MKALLNTILFVGILTTIQSCGKTEIEEINASSNTVSTNQKKALAISDKTESLFQFNIMRAYHNKEAYNLRYRVYTGPAADELIALSPMAGTIYTYADGLVSGIGTPFASIVNEISPFTSKQIVWKEVVIRINRGESPVQFRSERELLMAVRDSEGMIQLTEGTKVYQGSIFEFEKQLVGDDEN